MNVLSIITHQSFAKWRKDWHSRLSDVFSALFWDLGDRIRPVRSHRALLEKLAAEQKSLGVSAVSRLLANINNAALLWVRSAFHALDGRVNSTAVPQDKRASLDSDAAWIEAAIFQPFDIVTQPMKVLLIPRVLLIYTKVLPELCVDFV